MRQISASAQRRKASPAQALRSAAKFITSIVRANRQTVVAAAMLAATAANFICCILLDATGDIRYWYGVVGACATAAVSMYIMFKCKQ